MEITEFIDRVGVAVERLPNMLLLSYIQVAKDAKAIVQERVQETGMNANHVAFASIRPYTAKYLADKQHTTVSGKGSVKKKKNIKYKVTKKGLLIGRYRGFVDFTLSGAMWNSIDVLVEQAVVDRSGVKVTIDARSQENKNKLEGNVNGHHGFPGRGEIIQLAEDELDRLRENHEVIVKELFESFFE